MVSGLRVASRPCSPVSLTREATGSTTRTGKGRVLYGCGNGLPLRVRGPKTCEVSYSLREPRLHIPFTPFRREPSLGQKLEDFGPRNERARRKELSSKGSETRFPLASAHTGLCPALRRHLTRRITALPSRVLTRCHQRRHSSGPWSLFSVADNQQHDQQNQSVIHNTPF